jgi:hypothetical protein
VIWTLGGKRSTFRLGRGARFEWQHDAHLTGRVLTVFDDAFDDDGVPQAAGQSSAKVLTLDQRTMTVSAARTYKHHPPLLADVAGSVQRLPDHNVFVGWGSEPDFSEFTPQGRELFNGNFAVGVNTYRAYRFPWVGRPAAAPALATSQADGALKLYVSWNGATQVASWQAETGPTRGTLRPAGPRVPWRNFETEISVSTGAPYIAVQALDESGRVLGTTETLTAPKP